MPRSGACPIKESSELMKKTGVAILFLVAFLLTSCGGRKIVGRGGGGGGGNILESESYMVKNPMLGPDIQRGKSSQYNSRTAVGTALVQSDSSSLHYDITPPTAIQKRESRLK